LPKSFVTIPKIIEIPENSGNLPIPEINFLMRKNSEKDIVVLRVTTPIFDLKVSK
jgi:hypothetical protein